MRASALTRTKAFSLVSRRRDDSRGTDGGAILCSSGLPQLCPQGDTPKRDQPFTPVGRGFVCGGGERYPSLAIDSILVMPSVAFLSESHGKADAITSYNAAITCSSSLMSVVLYQ